MSNKTNLSITSSQVDLVEPADCQWGKQEGNGSWTGVVGAVQQVAAEEEEQGEELVQGLADLSMNLVVSGGREEVVDFSSPYIG